MKRHLITSALPYINGIKHLGNVVGSMLPADVYARFLRMQPDTDVLYICATDEHGTPAELAALEAGMSVADYCREQHAIQKELGERFYLSFDHFGRSSSQQNKELTQHFARKLRENGLIEERTTKQVYSIKDQRFLPDRYVVGTCPHCGYERARGDQCESCTKLLDPTDLIEPRSAVSGSTDLEIRESKHLFLRQTELEGTIRRWIESRQNWPKLVTSIALKWLDEGLRDRCITRDLEWGVPLPEEWEGFENKVFYVWFDAPIEYIAATKEWADEQPGRDWKSWWYEADDVNYTQFMAKDNVPFHTVSFPCTIFGSKEPWKLVDYIKGFNWLTYYGGKFSTTDRRGVFMNHAIELLPADYWRYYLLANAPESGDSSFTWEHFAATVNKDLADTFGNFINRAFKLCEKHFGAQVPEGGALDMEPELVAELKPLIEQYTQNLHDKDFRKSLQSLKAIWTVGNGYFDRREPWQTIKTDKDETARTLRTAINLVRVFAVLAGPIIPATSAAVLVALHLDPTTQTWVNPNGDPWNALAPGHPFTTPAPLFQKIMDEDVAAWEAQFGGG